MRHAATHFGIAWRRYRLIGVAEVAAAAGVLAGLLWRPAGLLAAAGMVLLMAGALIVHRRAHDQVREAFPALLALVHRRLAAPTWRSETTSSARSIRRGE